MKVELLVCVCVERKKFENEIYRGEDDILGIVKSGEFTFDTGAEKETVGEYEGVVFKKGITYHRKVTSPLVMYLFKYRSNVDFFKNSKIVFNDISRIKSTINMLDQLVDGLGFDDFKYRSSFLSDIFTQYAIENHYIRKELISDKLIEKSLEEINKNFNKNINLTEVAEKSFLSYVQFARRFKNSVGLTPKEYVNNMRMDRARYLLTESTITIKEIAIECGFSNEYYFSNFFKESNGISPTEYRKMSSSII